MKIGRLVGGRYRLKKRLAEGGMGEVWRAENELTNREFAVKFLRRELSEHPEALGRFLHEAKATGRLRHPSVVDVFDVGKAEDGRPFIVMELLAGESLDCVLARRGSLKPATASIYLAQIARALDLAHREGIVHRDVSPANIFLARIPGRREPVPKILDFGVSKNLGPELGERVRTGDGAVMGCPQYMSPEQASGAEKVDARADVWSLGAVMYECFAGTPPFRAKNYNALMCAILSSPHRPLAEACPGIDEELAMVADRCLEKDRERRIASARHVAIALERIAFRLSRRDDAARGPRRRAIDRLGMPTAWPVAPRTGGWAALGDVRPPLVRAASRLIRHAPRRGTVLVASAAVGVGLGVVLGVASSTDDDLDALASVLDSIGTQRLIAAAPSLAGPSVTPVYGRQQPTKDMETPRGNERRRSKWADRAPTTDEGAPVDPTTLPLWDQPLVKSTESLEPAADHHFAPAPPHAAANPAAAEAPGEVRVGLLRTNPYR